MAIMHLHCQMLSRSKGRNAVAAAAYRAGAELYDERTGTVFDYSDRTDVDGSEILLPDGAPEWARDRQQLWNAVEAAEKRKNSQVAREFDIALPVELDRKQASSLALAWADEQLVGHGLAVEVSFHGLGSKNPHVHVLCSTRELTADGFGKKLRDLDDRGQLEQWRSSWAAHANRALERAGRLERIDHRSYAARGLDLEPTIHEGYAARAMEKRGIESERAQLNRETFKRNTERRRRQERRQEPKRPQVAPQPQKRPQEAPGRPQRLSAVVRARGALMASVAAAAPVLEAVATSARRGLVWMVTEPRRRLQKARADREARGMAQLRDQRRRAEEKRYWQRVEERREAERQAEAEAHRRAAAERAAAARAAQQEKQAEEAAKRQAAWDALSPEERARLQQQRNRGITR